VSAGVVYEEGPALTRPSGRPQRTWRQFPSRSMFVGTAPFGAGAGSKVRWWSTAPPG